MKRVLSYKKFVQGAVIFSENLTVSEHFGTIFAHTQ
jgi:hypothetical protein